MSVLPKSKWPADAVKFSCGCVADDDGDHFYVTCPAHQHAESQSDDQPEERGEDSA